MSFNNMHDLSNPTEYDARLDFLPNAFKSKSPSQLEKASKCES